MAYEETLLARKRRGPLATGKGQQIVVRMHGDLLQPLDAFCDKQGGISRPEAIRLLVRDGLSQADAMPTNPAEQSTVPADSEILQSNENMAEDASVE